MKRILGFGLCATAIGVGCGGSTDATDGGNEGGAPPADGAAGDSGGTDSGGMDSGGSDSGGVDSGGVDSGTMNDGGGTCL